MERTDKQNSKTPRFITEIELEEITGVSRRTWQGHRFFGRGPRFYRIGGAIRYRLDEVLTWIESNSVDAGTKVVA